MAIGIARAAENWRLERKLRQAIADVGAPNRRWDMSCGAQVRGQVRLRCCAKSAGKYAGVC